MNEWGEEVFGLLAPSTMLTPESTQDTCTKRNDHCQCQKFWVVCYEAKQT